MVKSSKLYTPQTYLEAVTGKCFIINGDNDVETVENILDAEFGEGSYWTYSLEDISHIVEEELDVVLVDFLVWNDQQNEYEHVYRWAEVDENFKDN